MKKIISLVLVAAMALSMSMFMASCGGDSSDKNADLRVTGVVSTALGDKSFNDSAKEGLDKLGEEDGYETKMVECNADANTFEQNMRTAADSSDIVVAVGNELNMIETVAADYPDVKFVWVDIVADHLKDHDNLTCISYKQNEGSYLVGYIAAKMTKSNVVGFVGGQDIPVINDFYVGYEQGAKDANPDVKVVKNYTNDWADTDKGAACGQALKAQGADIIYAAAGGSGNGVILKAEELGIKAIGVDQDQRQAMPDYADQILCSMVKNVGNSIIDLVKDYNENQKWPGGEVVNAGMDGGYIGLAYGSEDMKQLVPQEIIDELDGVQKDIADGKIKVKTAL